jgi:hypothetical protein
MGDREYFRDRAQAERAAALKAKDMCAFRAHMDLAHEYEWRAVTEPRDPIQSRSEVWRRSTY